MEKCGILRESICILSWKSGSFRKWLHVRRSTPRNASATEPRHIAAGAMFFHDASRLRPSSNNKMTTKGAKNAKEENGASFASHLRALCRQPRPD
jgi:hypothetical protein